MLALTDIYQASLEGDVDGKVRPEIEYTYICSFTDYNFLEEATRVEVQEQYELRASKQASVNAALRVRKTVKGEDVEHVLTSKLYREDSHCDEVEVEVSEDLFNHFKSMSPSGAHKTRYTFEINDLTWEVDVYEEPSSGERSLWCRIELELEDTVTTVPELPFKADQVIRTWDQTDSERELVDKLYETLFIRKNGESIAPLID